MGMVWVHIIIPSEDSVQAFGKSLEISHIVANPQENHRPWLILNLLKNPYAVTPYVNGTIFREAKPYFLEFKCDLPYIFQ